MDLHAIVMLLGVFIASIAQVLLKKSAQKVYDNIFKEYLNMMVVLGYSMMLISTMCTVYAYRKIPISLAMVLDATGYVFATLFGYLFFGETISARRILALLLIILGILVYAISI